MKVIVWKMDAVVSEKMAEGMTKKDAVDAMAAWFKARWGQDKCKAAQACADLKKAVAPEAGD